MPKTNLKPKIVDINNLSRSKSPTSEMLLLTEVINQSTSLKILFNEKGLVISSNTTAQKLLGYSKAKIVTKTFSHLFDTKKTVKQLFKPKKTEVKQKLKISTAQNKLVEIEVRFNLIKQSDSNYVLATIIPAHLTSSKLGFNLSLKEVINASSNFIFIKSLDGKFLMVNNALSNFLNLKQRDIIGHTVNDLNIDKEEITSFNVQDAELLLSGKKMVIAEECITNTKSGEKKWFTTTKTLIDGHFSHQRSILGISTEITEVKLIKQRLAANSISQDIQRNFLKLVIDANPALIYVKNLEGRIVLANKAYGEFMGVDASEMVGLLISDFFFNKKILNRVSKEDTKIIESNKAFQKLNHKFKCPTNGKLGWYNVTKIPIQGPIPKILVVANDVTQLYYANKKLKSQTEKLSSSNSELEQFAYIASHDLKEPLRMISSYLQLLQNCMVSESTDARDYLHFALDGANRMQQLTTDLLHYSRLGARSKPFTQVNLNEVLDVVKLNLRNSISENNATIIHKELPQVKGDFTQLTQLFQNLIENGIKFKSNLKPIIKIEGKSKNDEVTLTFKDNGIGIEEGMQERIFEIFQRLHTKQEFAGTGIGLSICKKIIERHGGKIWINGNKNQGTTFHATIHTSLIE